MGPRIASARFWLREASGALGDFGTFVPLAVAAGLFVAVAMALLGLLGLIRSFARLVPDAVLRGLQLTVARELLLSGLRTNL
jgi:hypothetical protein